MHDNYGKGTWQNSTNYHTKKERSQLLSRDDIRWYNTKQYN